MNAGGAEDRPRWLVLLMPFEQGRIRGRDKKAAETDLDHVRILLEDLIDGEAWLNAQNLACLYVALHPVTGDGKVGGVTYQRHQDTDLVNVEFSWKTFAALDVEDRQWRLLDLLLGALRSPKTVARLGLPPLRRSEHAIHQPDSMQSSGAVLAPNGAADLFARRDSSVLDGVSHDEVVILRPFPPGAPDVGSLEIVERYDRDLDSLLGKPDGGAPITDSEINAGFVRWVINAAAAEQ